MSEVHQLLLILCLLKVGLDPALVYGGADTIVCDDRLGNLFEKNVLLLGLGFEKLPVGSLCLSLRRFCTEHFASVLPLLSSEIRKESFFKLNDALLNDLKVIKAHVCSIFTNLSVDFASLLCLLLQYALLLFVQLKLFLLLLLSFLHNSRLRCHEVSDILLVLKLRFTRGLLKDRSLDSIFHVEDVADLVLLSQEADFEFLTARLPRVKRQAF